MNESPGKKPYKKSAVYVYKDAAIHLKLGEESLGPSVHAGLRVDLDSDYRVMVKRRDD